MNRTEPKYDPDPMPRIRTVKAVDGCRISVEWIAGPRTRVSEIVDLSPLIEQMKFYAPLRDDLSVFLTARLTADGEAIEWGDGSIDMAATTVERLAGSI